MPNQADTEVSHERTGASAVSTVYKSGNRTITVNSTFGTADLTNLLYELVKAKLTLEQDAEDAVYLGSSQPDGCAPQVGGTR